MLPDDFENLSQAVIATDFMSNNILSAITTKNYWDAVNEYKPLMHFWYVGILVEFYMLMPLVLLITSKVAKFFNKNFHSFSLIVVWVLFLGSLVLYLFSNMPQGDKFYYLPCRLFELLAGGIIGIYVSKHSSYSFSANVGYISMVSVLLLMFGAWYLPVHSDNFISPVTGQITCQLIVSPVVLLLASVVVTCVILASKNVSVMIQNSMLLQGIAFIGKMSFSIFVWHQILLAFYRYFVNDDMSLAFGVGLWLITLSLSSFTYYGIEQRVQPCWKNFGFSVIFFLLTVIPAGWVYTHAGVIRDVPELGIKKGVVHRGLFAEYCDRVYGYNKDFTQDAKLKVLVEGVSFGRDFVNILLESSWADKIELSYIFNHDPNYKQRYADCDILFTFHSKKDVPDYVWNNLRDSARVIGIGTKNFGVCNGVIYQKRNEADYFNQTISIHSNFYILNDLWRNDWGVDNYLDFLKLSTAQDGKIRVFTDNHKFISQDCRHLTQDGAKWLAGKLESDTWFKALMAP